MEVQSNQSQLSLFQTVQKYKSSVYLGKKITKKEDNERRKGPQNGNVSECFFFVFFLSPCAGFSSAQLSLFWTKYSKLNHIEHLLSAFCSMQIINSELVR